MAAVTATRPSRATPTRVKSSASGSTSVRLKVARRGTAATATTTAGTFSSESLPVKPKVDIGPKAYRVYRNGDRKVIRFSVGHGRFRRSGKHFYTKKFYVFDMDTGKVAAKTSKDGYEKKEAVKVARRYRDTFGAYARVGF